MKRTLAFLLVLLMIPALLGGCVGGSPEGAEELPAPTQAQTPAPTSEPSPAPTTEPSPAPTPEPTPEPRRELSWARAFRDESAPAGSITPEEIAFRCTNEKGEQTIINVPCAQVSDWWEQQETLPRSRYFEQFMPEALRALYPVLDYAMAFGYSSFCVPSTGFTPTDVAVGKFYLLWMYRINGSIINAENVGSFDLGGGQTLQYILITLRGINRSGSDQYRQAIALAREIVAGIPEGSGESERMLYLYNWLTENVSYDDGDYYGSEWNLLYDTLVLKKTVCAGYAEALYVLCNLAGIECITVMGSLYDGQNWEGHAWNAAKIDGDFYHFDSTWDTGRTPEHYRFYGVSDDTLQSYAPRLVQGPPEESRPQCGKDLPIPGREAAAALTPGAVEECSYSQPFMGLELHWDKKWTVLSREEITEAMYGGMELSMDQILRLGFPYVDLILQRNGRTVQVMLELSPVTSSAGLVCDTPESYMDEMEQLLPAELEAAGLRELQTRRFEQELGGRSFACLTVTGGTALYSYCQTFLCTGQDGLFLTVVVAGFGEQQCEQTVAELFSGEP